MSQALGVLLNEDHADLFDRVESALVHAAFAHTSQNQVRAAKALGITPDANGLADHVRIGDEWERTDGRISIVAALLDQLAGE